MTSSVPDPTVPSLPHAACPESVPQSYSRVFTKPAPQSSVFPESVPQMQKSVFPAPPPEGQSQASSVLFHQSHSTLLTARLLKVQIAPFDGNVKDSILLFYYSTNLLREWHIFEHVCRRKFRNSIAQFMYDPNLNPQAVAESKRQYGVIPAFLR